MLACRRGLPGRLFSSVTVAALFAASAASAQDRAANPTLLDTVVIGAGTPKVATDTPQAVTVVDQEDLDREQPRTVGDIFTEVPGVTTVGSSARPLGQVFNIRGIGTTDDSASENRIIVTIDGAPKFFEQYRTGGFFADPELFKRVEALRGPASSTLYGTGAIGGVIAFTTKDAADFLSEGKNTAVRAKLGYGSNGSRATGTLTLAQRLGDQADLLASFSTGSSAIVEDGDGAEIPSTKYDRWSMLLKGNYHFGEARDKTLSLSLSRSKTDIDNADVVQSGGATEAAVFGQSNLHARDDTVTLSYRDRAEGNPWLDLLLQYSFSDTATNRDNFTPSSPFITCGAGSFSVLCDNEARYKTSSFKIENTMEFGAGAWSNHVTVGAQWAHQNRAAKTTVGQPAFHPGGTDEKTGFYVQGEFVWNDRLTITPGVRVDRGSLSPNATARAQGGADYDETAISPKIAALYHITDDWGVFGALSRTERMPSLDELYSSDGMGTAGRTPSLGLEKERANAVEAGVVWTRQGLFSEGDALAAKLTVFNYNMNDLITYRPRSGSAGLPYFYNVEAARIWGAELEADYEADRWFARLSYSKVKSKDKSTGETLATTPAETAALTLGAKCPDYGARLSWRLRGARGIETSSSTTTAAGYGAHDLFATWAPQDGAMKGIEVNLGVENVFDRNYRENLSVDQSPGRDIVLSVARAFEW